MYKNHSLTSLLLLFSFFGRANDGAFKVNGNQLIPMYETSISVQKEILTIERIPNKDLARVEVYYEFFNPGEEKTMEVGFEAFSPSGDANPSPQNGKDRYIYTFAVFMNDSTLPYHVAIVSDSLYYKNGKFKTKPLADAIRDADGDDPSFFYVYHFKARFKKGLNIIRHSYSVELSDRVYENYDFLYVLTAAKRWANKQIDDFTLQINMGDFQDLCIDRKFFQHAAEWSVDGIGKGIDVKARAGYEDNVAEFFVRKGTLVFKKMNFKPGGELQLYAYSSPYYAHSSTDEDHFNYRLNTLPFSPEQDLTWKTPVDELSKRIQRNLPFARRGYIFKSPELQAYYEKQPWYIPDPAYQADAALLPKKEQELLKE